VSFVHVFFVDVAAARLILPIAHGFRGRLRSPQMQSPQAWRPSHHSCAGVDAVLTSYGAAAASAVAPHMPPPLLPLCSHMFEGKSRMFEVQVQGRFRRLPDGELYIGIEIGDRMKLGLMTMGLCKALLSFGQRMNRNIHYR
jgi:Protein of unknown function (DUF1769)